MYGTGNTMNNIIITLYDDRWLLSYCGDHIVRCTNVESLCCPLEINIPLYFNYTLIVKYSTTLLHTANFKKGSIRNKGKRTLIIYTFKSKFTCQVPTIFPTSCYVLETWKW